LSSATLVVSATIGSLRKTTVELREENQNLKDQLAASLLLAEKSSGEVKRLAEEMNVLKQRNDNREGVLQLMKTQAKTLKQRLKECSDKNEV
jgi:predicted nuclease with TOPRIM domain